MHNQIPGTGGRKSMTDQQLQALKKYIKFKNIIDMIPVPIPNWPEKLSCKKVRGICREFTEVELGYIEAALLAISDTILQNTKRE